MFTHRISENIAFINEAKDINEDCYILVFKDMEKRYRQIVQLVAKLEKEL